MKKMGPVTVSTIWTPAGGGGGGGSEPGLTVSGRADGEAYNVSAGARSLSISNPDGATLATTVEKASDGAAISVTNSTATNPSWTAPSGSTAGEAVQVKVSATKSGLSTSVSFTERIAGAGSSGASWVELLDLDLTALSAATLSAGTQTVGGVAFNCEAAGETVGGGAGLTAAAAKYSYVDVSSSFTSESPRLVELKIVNAAWGGTGTGHAVRGRLFADTAGSGPAAQTRYYPNSGNMRFQAQWQHRYSGSSGGFSTSGGNFDHSGDGAILPWYSYIAMVRGTYYVWISKTQDVPADLADLMTPDAFTWVVGINAYSALGTANYFPATALAGLFNQNAGSAGLLENIRCWEFK